MRRLITIPLSHYCEKARWALERAGVDFTEEPHLPALAALHAHRAGGSRTTPVLVAAEGVLGESADIVRYADARAPEDLRLVPTDEADRRAQEAFEAELDAEFGPHVRRFAYGLVLDSPRVLVDVTRGRVPAGEHLAFRLLRPLFVQVLVRALRITPAGVERSRGVVLATLDRVDALLADGRPHPSGDRFGVLDFTFAALGAPLVLPPEHPGGMPTPDQGSERLGALVRELRERPSGRWILARYRERTRARHD